MSKIDPSKIHLVNIRILKAWYEVRDGDYSNAPIQSFLVKSKSESGFIFDENSMRFRLYIKLESQNEKNEPLAFVAEYIAEFHFLIDNLSDFVEGDEKDGEKKVLRELGATIAGISYSTLRGIILDRTQATEFNGAIIPIINPDDLLEDGDY